jgi:AraC family transcriptional regulator, ethanolamine operon transcriptional activator
MAVARDHDLTLAAAGVSLKASLLDKLDLVFDSFAFPDSCRQAKCLDILKTLRAVDDFVNSRASGPIYSEEVASALGISVRTLTNLMVRANGMSLQRYLRLRRLWSVRRQLLTGEPKLQVKMVAYANGFWHLGDFAAKYFSEFGELPSSTYSRALASR